MQADEIDRFLSGDRVRTVQTIADAYLLAHEIEFSEVNAIFKFLAVKSVSLEARSDFVLSQLSEHQEKITSFSRTFGGRDWRRRVLAQAYPPHPIEANTPVSLSIFFFRAVWPVKPMRQIFLASEPFPSRP